MPKDGTTKAERFIIAINWLCKQHGLSLAHEDTQGAFIIEPFKEKNIDWLSQAMVSEEVKE